MFFKRKKTVDMALFKEQKKESLNYLQIAFSILQEKQYKIISKNIEDILPSEEELLSLLQENFENLKRLYEVYENCFSSINNFSEEKIYINNKEIKKILKKLNYTENKTGTDNVSHISNRFKAKTSEELYKEYINS